MAKDVLVASEAKAQTAHLNGQAAADMLDHIEDSLAHMKTQGLAEAQALGEAIKKVVQNFVQGKPAPDTQPAPANQPAPVSQPVSDCEKTGKKASTYAAAAAGTVPTATATTKPLYARNTKPVRPA